MQAPVSRSPLLLLPAELRNDIYRYTLCGRIINTTNTSMPKNLLGLLLTCRQTHQKAELLAYSGNTFLVVGHHFENWLRKRTGPQLAAIASIEFEHRVDLVCERGQATWTKVNYGMLKDKDLDSISKRLPNVDTIATVA